jgi:magnesium chelatase family protein
MEDGKLTISRAAGKITLPCKFMLVAAMNPCKCGYYGSTQRRCRCTPQQVSAYRARVSGPLLDRIDIHVEVPPVDFDKLSDAHKGEPSARIRERVEKARKIQQERLRGTAANCNAQMNPAMTREFCVASEGAMKMLQMAFDKLGLSARAYDKILRVARTIADLDGSEIIETPHIAEAIQYRSLDRKFWNK